MSATLQPSNPLHPQMERQDNLNVHSVVPGIFFMREGAVVEVTAVNSNVVTIHFDETLNE